MFLRLQPYKKTCLKAQGHHKLELKFYGPYQIIKCISFVSYKLSHPATSKIHQVFHVSYLKKVVGNCRIQTILSKLDDEGSLWLQPKSILNTYEN